MLRPRKRPRSGGAWHADGDSSDAENSDVSGSQDDAADAADEEDDEAPEECYNCTHAAPDGFTCAEGEPHLQCHFCQEIFPWRQGADSEATAGPAVPSPQCKGCGLYTCGPYFRWHGRQAGPLDAAMNKCWTQSVPLEEVEFPAAGGDDIPASIFKWNAVEREIVKECMASAGFNATELFRHCVRELRAGRLQCSHDALGPGLSVVAVPGASVVVVAPVGRCLGHAAAPSLD